MTKTEFIRAYCEKSGVSWHEVSDRLIALPCVCGDELCEGWAMVPNDPVEIELHTRLRAPKKEAQCDT